jgi:copper transport protein
MLFWHGGPPGDQTLALAASVPRFSLIATAAVGGLALTGLYLTGLHLGALGDLASSPYGRVLLAKLAVMGAMLALGAYHQRVAHPRLLAALAGTGPTPDRAAAAFRRTVRVEAAAGAAALLLGAALAATPPARGASQAEPPPFRHEYHADDARLVLEIGPLRPGPVALRARVTDHGGQPLGDARAALVQLVPGGGGVGPVAVTLDPAGPGAFAGRATLGLAGAWRGRLVIQREGAYDLNHRFEIVLAEPGPAPARTTLVITLGVAAVVVSIATAIGLRSASRLRRAGVPPSRPPHPAGRPARR